MAKKNPFPFSHKAKEIDLGIGHFAFNSHNESKLPYLYDSKDRFNILLTNTSLTIFLSTITSHFKTHSSF